MMDSSITFSAPGKIHLLGEHSVVYGKPALLAAVNLRVTVTLHPSSTTYIDTIVSMYVKNTIEDVVKRHLGITSIPPYQLDISSQLPIGAGLGSSAAVSAAYIAALLTFLKVPWDKSLINDLAYEAEKVFHGNPSGGDNSAVVFGGLIWFRKENPDLKIIQPLPFTIPSEIAKNFILINTGSPKETTKEMVEMVDSKIQDPRSKIKKLFDDQEALVKELVTVLKEENGSRFMQIIKTGEKNLESLGVVSPYAAGIIRKIEKAGGAAKICGGGGKTGPTGVLLCYHTKPSLIQNIAKFYNLDYFKTVLGVAGLRQE